MTEVRPLTPLAALDPAATRALLARDVEHAALRTRPADWLLEREARRLARVVEVEEGFGFFAPGAGLTLVRPLPWDSEHFGFRCADLVRLYVAANATEATLGPLIDATLATAHARGVRLLGARPLARELGVVDLLQRRHSFRLVDTSVELGLARGPGSRTASPRPPEVQVAEGRAGQRQALVQMAKTFVDNRFHRDPAIDPERATALYARWVEGALDRGELLVVEVDGRPAGFATHRHPSGPEADDDGVGVVGLVVVGPEHRGRGAFGPLIDTSVAHLDCEAVASSTQVSNIAALRAFARHGLLPIDARHVLHGWL